jgi:hypothetical protein
VRRGTISLVSFLNTDAISISIFRCDNLEEMALEGVALADEQERRSTGQAVLVTDLSRDLINYLGGTLQITPDSLEEHLVCSGYTPFGHYDPDPRLWHSRTVPKDYVSLQWYSPVHLSRYGERCCKKWFTLMTEGQINTSDGWTSLATNIVRRAWPGFVFRRSSWDRDKAIIAPWEERITFTWGQLNGKRTRMFRLPETISSLIPSANNMNQLCSLRTLSRGWCFPCGPESPQRPYLTHAVRCERRHWA